jgi:hypothetical protein
MCPLRKNKRKVSRGKQDIDGLKNLNKDDLV